MRSTRPTWLGTMAYRKENKAKVIIKPVFSAQKAYGLASRVYVQKLSTFKNMQIKILQRKLIV